MDQKYDTINLSNIKIQRIHMIKSFCTLFLGASSLACSMDGISGENINPNLQPQIEHTLEKDQSLEIFKKAEEPLVDHRSTEEIRKKIKYLKAKKRGYQSFNQDHDKVIQQLMEKEFFENSFPANNTEVLKILESVFTNNYGQGGPWGYIVRELDRRPQRFIKEFNQLRYDVMHKASEKNIEIRKILDEIDMEIRAAGFMIVYYWNNRP